MSGSRTPGSPDTKRTRDGSTSTGVEPPSDACPNGYELGPPVDEGQLAAFHSVCDEVGADGRNVVSVQQREVEGRGIDDEDRILRGAGLVRRLLDAGL